MGLKIFFWGVSAWRDIGLGTLVGLRLTDVEKSVEGKFQHQKRKIVLRYGRIVLGVSVIMS